MLSKKGDGLEERIADRLKHGELYFKFTKEGRINRSVNANKYTLRWIGKNLNVFRKYINTLDSLEKYIRRTK